MFDVRRFELQRVLPCGLGCDDKERDTANLFWKGEVRVTRSQYGNTFTTPLLSFVRRLLAFKAMSRACAHELQRSCGAVGHGYAPGEFVLTGRRSEVSVLRDGYFGAEFYARLGCFVQMFHPLTLFAVPSTSIDV